jgi:hypothetical protein
MNIQTILLLRFANDDWTLSGENYEGLTWLSETPKPTKEFLESLWNEVQAEIAEKQIAKVAARDSALAKLAALGLTAEEIASL